MLPARSKVVAPKVMELLENLPVTMMLFKASTVIEWGISSPIAPSRFAQITFPWLSNFTIKISPTFPALIKVSEPKTMVGL